ncbi:MAG TPA: hypothetical protein VF137_01780 [Candidatus Dormibacteraeota bacterium]
MELVNSSNFGAMRLPSRWRGGPDVVVHLLGTPASLNRALDALGRGGRLVGVAFPVAPRELVFREISVLA